MLKIQGEDKAMVEQLRYDQLPAESNVRADLPQIMFRKLRQQVGVVVVGGGAGAPGWPAEAGLRTWDCALQGAWALPTCLLFVWFALSP